MVEQETLEEIKQAHLDDLERISVLEGKFLEALSSLSAEATFEQLQELAKDHQFEFTLREIETDHILELKYPRYINGGGMTISGIFDDQQSAIEHAFQFVIDQLTEGAK